MTEIAIKPFHLKFFYLKATANIVLKLYASVVSVEPELTDQHVDHMLCTSVCVLGLLCVCILSTPVQTVKSGLCSLVYSGDFPNLLSPRHSKGQVKFHGTPVFISVQKLPTGVITLKHIFCVY